MNRVDLLNDGAADLCAGPKASKSREISSAVTVAVTVTVTAILTVKSACSVKPSQNDAFSNGRTYHVISNLTAANRKRQDPNEARDATLYQPPACVRSPFGSLLFVALQSTTCDYCCPSLSTTQYCVMSLQRVARVGVRQLRLADGLGRPGRVVGIESQLRQLTLSTQPRQLIQPVGASSSILFQHSRLFSTQGACLSDSTSKTPARPRRKTKSNKQRKPKARAPTKKVLTEKQKENKAKQQQREHIKALKETALQPPKKLSVKPNNLAFMELHPANKQTTSSVTEAFVKTVNQVKELPRHEYEVGPCSIDNLAACVR